MSSASMRSTACIAVVFAGLSTSTRMKAGANIAGRSAASEAAWASRPAMQLKVT